MNRAILSAIVALTLSCSSALAAITLPTGGRQLWLSADNEVTGAPVTQWNDAGVNKDWILGTIGSPTPATSAYPAGTRNVIQFDGNDGLQLVDDDTLDSANPSVYLVGKTYGGQGTIFFANYTDVNQYGLGISDSTANRVKWFTAPGGDALDNGPASGADLTTGNPYLISAQYSSATFGSANDKTLRVSGDGVSFSSNSTNNGGAIATPTAGTAPYIGVLEPGNRQFLNGEIAEVVMYDTGSNARRLVVETYLSNKYFGTQEPIVYQAGPDMAAMEAGAPSNPNGAWSYGTTATLGGAFVPLATHQDDWSGDGGSFQGYAPGTLSVPAVVVNTAATSKSPCCGFSIESQTLFMHPGGSNEFDVVRWTAPDDGSIRFAGDFLQRGGKAAVLDIRLNNVSILSGLGTLAFDQAVSLAVLSGATLDFIVGPDLVGDPGDPSNSRSTQFDATVLFTPIPEPCGCTIAGLGVLSVVVLHRRRRGSYFDGGSP